MESLTVPGNLDYLEAIASYVINAAKEAGLDKKATYRLRLAVDEIATNIIMYGYKQANIEGKIDLETKLEPQYLAICLEDTGVFYDPTKHEVPKDLDLPLEERTLGGQGIYLVIQSVDKLTYERVQNRNRTTFIVNRNSS
ncbi:MAG: anti-sigma regulatory factor [Moorea sp. SIO2B7]|nr:anti-sigma regulatory factor [Moorena sp. SIO2B7]